MILGAVILSMINRFILPELNGVPDSFGLDFDVTSVNFGVYGLLLLVMMVLRPEGLLPSTRRKLELHGAEADETTEMWFEEPDLYESRHDDSPGGGTVGG